MRASQCQKSRLLALLLVPACAARTQSASLEGKGGLLSGSSLQVFTYAQM